MLSACSSATDARSVAAPDRGALLASVCSGCHGRAPGKVLASLDAMQSDDLLNLLRAYRDDAHGTTVMHRIARGYTDAELGLIAASVTR